MYSEIVEKLKFNNNRNQVIHHPFFNLVKNAPLVKAQTEVFLGQYWYPIHYFPTFLAQVVAHVPQLELKSFITKILWQETGEGSPVMAHEKLYLDTMDKAGFSCQNIVNGVPFAETQALIEGYQAAGSDYLLGLGFVYGTEVIDMTIVAGLGLAVRRTSLPGKSLSWVDIHVKQEPEHVECATESISNFLTREQEAAIITSAENAWRLWTDFFSALARNTSLSAP